MITFSESQQKIVDALEAIPDNATNGDVIKAMFKPNRIARTDDDIVHIDYDFTPEWWNAPYQKGGKE